MDSTRPANEGLSLMDSNDRILITGATGFIGGRLLEVLADRGARIRVATSDFRNCSRVSRFAVEMVKADLRDHNSLVNAVSGCNVVFHLAYRFGGTATEERQANLDGTRALAEAFLKNGGRRFVHISSVSAYGDPRDEELTEETPQRATTDTYSATKQEIERPLRELHRNRGLAVTILQPTIVYGPYGSTWTTPLLGQVRSTRIALPAGGLGLCNAVYVDDVVAAAMLAVERDAAVGETFLISGASPITWREFYAAYEKMLGKQAVLDVDDNWIRTQERLQRKHDSLYGKLRRELARRPGARQYLLSLPPQSWLVAAAQQLPASAQAALKSYYRSLWQQQISSDASLPLFLPGPELRKLYAARTHVHIDKARNKLGYNPAFDLDRGMALTKEWAAWANLLRAQDAKSMLAELQGSKAASNNNSYAPQMS
jgi:nucleoside-diphosphate-sugar epimerase